MSCHVSSSGSIRTSIVQTLGLIVLVSLSLGSAGCSRQFAELGGSARGEAQLGIGDAAPPLNIASWMHRQPADSGFEGRVHVVEFWATWCGPCLASMPHMSQLQDRFGDEVRFIGITKEDAGTVEAFLASESPVGRPWNEIITYALATDNNDATNIAYMKAANQSGIPAAFIVGRSGKIEWIGHPGRIDGPLQQVVDGTWNQQAAIEEDQQQQMLSESRERMNQFVMNQEWDNALKLLDEIEQKMGPNPILAYNRLTVLQAAGRTQQAAAAQVGLVELAWDDALLLNSIAWNLATDQEGQQDLDLALKAANRASELTEASNGDILDTVARVHYERGELATAIEWQRKAVEHNSGRGEIDATLQQYLAEQGAGAPSEAEAADETQS